MATETKSIPIIPSTFTLIAGPGLVSIHSKADDEVQICIAPSLPSPTTSDDDIVNLPKGWSTLTVTDNSVYARSAGRQGVLLPVVRG